MFSNRCVAMPNPNTSLEFTRSSGLGEPWSRAKRILFRFAFSFWALFCLDSGLTNFLFWFWPWLNNTVGDALDWPLTKINLWVGAHVFHLTGVAATFHNNGAGDHALNWIRALELLVLSACIGAAWNFISEARGRRFEYRTLHQWLRLAMRFLLASSLLTYGFYKVFPLQFPPATPEQLAVTYADSSPMGLLWRFMGASPLYSLFGGLAEVIPGLLLLFRRTATLGALGATAVLLNVVALNFSYDVTVKLYSTELLLMALFLLLPDILPLWLIFIKNESAHLSRSRVPRSGRRALRIAATILQVLTIGWLLYTNGLGAWRMWRAQPTPLAGSWKVDSAGEALAKEGWTSLSTVGRSSLQILSGGKPQFRKVDIDADAHLLRIFGDLHEPNSASQPPVGVLHWTPEEQDRLRLIGTWQNQPATLLLHRSLPNSKLETRGFHLVQEENFNR